MCNSFKYYQRGFFKSISKSTHDYLADNMLPRLRYRKHGFMANVGDQKKCDFCQKLFQTQQGLDNHQSRDNPQNRKCHRIQVLQNRDVIQGKANERKFNVKSVRLQNHHVNVSLGAHPMGSPIQAKEKRCILNLYQSFIDDGTSVKDAKHETSRRLGFSPESVTNTIKEMIANGYVQDNNNARRTPNAYEKLADEEVDDIRKIIHEEMRTCNVKRMTEENEGVKYPTIGSLHKAVLQTGRYPQWSYITFRDILLGMGIKMKAKSEID